MTTLRRVHVLISGRVQGVAFRDAARNKAEELDLRGWVRNLVDGRVEALFQGPPAAVEQALVWCHQGPEAAAVKDVVTHDEPTRDDMSSFAIRPTANESLR